MSDSFIKMCAVNPRTGFCQKCRQHVPVERDGEPEHCGEQAEEISNYDADSGEWDWDKDVSIEEIDFSTF